MIAECCTRATQAVKALENLPVGSVDAASEMRVRAALASALPYVRGPVSESAEPSRGVFTLAIECGEPEFHACAGGLVPSRGQAQEGSSTQV
jgi:hypothetical protein